jgi:hypothetical protein
VQFLAIGVPVGPVAGAALSLLFCALSAFLGVQGVMADLNKDGVVVPIHRSRPFGRRAAIAVFGIAGVLMFVLAGLAMVIFVAQLRVLR